MRAEIVEIVNLLAERAPALRAAGVTSFTIGDFAVDFAPHEQPPPPPRRRADEDDPAPDASSDPMQDPATYGGGRVPGFTRPKGGA